MSHDSQSGERLSPAVSIIMNCLNCEKYLSEAIDSVFNQTCRDWEIIFWDNASGDDSGRVAQGYDARLKYYRSPDGVMPLGEARNRAMEKASGKYIAFLDCDDTWVPEKLEKQVPLFNDEKVGLVFSNARRCFQQDGSSVLQWHKGSGSPSKGQVFSSLLTNYPIVLSTAMVRRQAIDGLDGAFESTLEYSEEFDLFIRIAHAWHVDYVDEPLIKLRVHSESVSQNKYSVIQKELAFIMGKFEKAIPGFNEKHGGDVRKLLKSASFTEGVYFYRDNKPDEARDRFRSHLLDPKFFLAYIATFLFDYGTLKRIQVFLMSRNT